MREKTHSRSLSSRNLTISTIYSVLGLLMSFGVLCLGHGLQNTIIGIRAALEGYPDWIIGLMNSAYYLGFSLGPLLCIRSIYLVGEIRTFAVFTSAASAVALTHAIMIGPTYWVLLRFIYGFCIAALYVVIESWLNAFSSKGNRGRILSIYRIISFLFLALGQLFIFISEPTSYVLFAVSSILISFALVPLTISRTKQPQRLNREHFGIKKLYKISPLATLGCFGIGLSLGSFWGLGPVYFSRLGLSAGNVGIVLALSFVGSLIFEGPIGYFSDMFDRRFVIFFTLFLACLIPILFFIFIIDAQTIDLKIFILSLLLGGFCYPLYSLFIALANDFLEPKYFVQASSGLIIFNAAGSTLGPFLASLLMIKVGNHGLFLFLAVVHGALLIIALLQMFKGRKIPEITSEAFVPVPQTAITVVELDPRGE